MKIIEGIKVIIAFGHYKTDEECNQTWLYPDLRKDVELTTSNGIAGISESNLPNIKKEFIDQVSKAFDTLVEDHKRRLKYEQS